MFMIGKGLLLKSETSISCQARTKGLKGEDRAQIKQKLHRKKKQQESRRREKWPRAAGLRKCWQIVLPVGKRLTPKCSFSYNKRTGELKQSCSVETGETEYTEQPF